MRPAVKKLYHLRPEVSASCVSDASRVVNPKHDELRRAVSKGAFRRAIKIAYCWKYFPAILPAT